MRYIATFLLGAFFAAAAFAQGPRAESFSAVNMSGDTVELASLKGKVVLVTFWTTRCTICNAEIPRLNKLAVAYRGRDVAFIAPTTDNEEKVARYVANNPFEFNILPNSFGLLLKYANRDRDGNLDMGYPSYFLIGRDGTIQYRANGWNKIGQIQSSIDRLLSAD